MSFIYCTSVAFLTWIAQERFSACLWCVCEINSNTLRHIKTCLLRCKKYHIVLKMLCWTGSLKQRVGRKSYFSSDLVLWAAMGEMGNPRLVYLSYNTWLLGRGRDDSCFLLALGKTHSPLLVASLNVRLYGVLVPRLSLVEAKQKLAMSCPWYFTSTEVNLRSLCVSYWSSFCAVRILISAHTLPFNCKFTW